ncbi:hypothetical protein [Kitasatospora viridis]|uniref:Uncharacterized protein n=1 Tax=Kitasatospora viridis TaxID=281105 RepID=A0A561SEF1_9ACTN|nr:hypothetical protein [Kitasatospora viridis]TWF73234.1 hypothetical protein FHX73_16385 [Kitasatospora viridis]
MLLTWIAEVADEPLVLEPADRRAEWATNTWWLGAGEEERRALAVPDVVAAFEWTADRIRLRLRELGFAGVATFYVWHDEQAGQLRCSTGSVSAAELPFGGAHLATDDLGPIVAGYLADREPGVVAWSELSAAQEAEEAEESEESDDQPVRAPFPVWVRAVGAGS